MIPKKKFDLTTDIVKIEGGANDISNTVSSTQESRKKIEVKKEKKVMLGVFVEESIQLEFKIWCTRHKMKMNDGFLQSFKALKDKYGA